MNPSPSYARRTDPFDPTRDFEACRDALTVAGRRYAAGEVIAKDALGASPTLILRKLRQMYDNRSIRMRAKGEPSVIDYLDTLSDDQLTAWLKEHGKVTRRGSSRDVLLDAARRIVEPVAA